LPSTVKGIRLKLGLLQHRSPSHPRQIAGYLTVPPLAEALGLPPPWGYHQIKRGTVAIPRDAATGLSLFPDAPETLEACRPLRMGQRTALRSCVTLCHLAPRRAAAGGDPRGGRPRAGLTPAA